jgi:hypothetical protein
MPPPGLASGLPDKPVHPTLQTGCHRSLHRQTCSTEEDCRGEQQRRHAELREATKETTEYEASIHMNLIAAPSEIRHQFWTQIPRTFVQIRPTESHIYARELLLQPQTSMTDDFNYSVRTPLTLLTISIYDDVGKKRL